MTLCGLLFYRGFARWFTADQTQGFGQASDSGLRLLATGKPCSTATLIMICGIVLAVYFVCRLLRGVLSRAQLSGTTIGRSGDRLGDHGYWFVPILARL